MKDKKVGNIWHALTRCILYIFIEKSPTKKFNPIPLNKTVVKEKRGWSQEIYLRYLKLNNLYRRHCLFNRTNIHEKPGIGDFFDSNLKFTIFTWVLANDFHRYKKNIKNLQKISFLI